MIVITVTDCPNALRGDLTKWLFEIDTGIYVGKPSARVRDEIWNRVTENVKTGRATMVFSASNEQGMDFRIHNAVWEPIDFDGIKLILRPSPSRLKNKQIVLESKKIISNASKYHTARKLYGKQKRKIIDITKDYTVIDIETTGLSAYNDEIIELAAISVAEGEVVNEFQALICPKRPVSQKIIDLTGLTNEILIERGSEITEVLPKFLSFLGSSHIVVHNAKFDIGFINEACKKSGLPEIKNLYTDTMLLAREKVVDVINYKLRSLLDYFKIEIEREHRGINDCIATQKLYVKLNILNK